MVGVVVCGRRRGDSAASIIEEKNSNELEASELRSLA